MKLIGIDLGGTKVTGAMFDSNGSLLYKTTRLIEGRKGLEVGSLMKNIIDFLIKVHSEGIDAIAAIGICVPGIVNSKTGKVWAPNISGWEEYALQQEIEEYINQPHIKVSVDNDRTCYILGEVWKGAAQGCDNAIFVAVGTGIGAGILIDGRILHGLGDIVGAAGWMALETPYSEEYKACGYFETLASGNGIAKQAKKMIQNGVFQKSIMNQKPTDSLTAYDVFAAYEQGDDLATQILDKAVQVWGMGAANLVSLFNPEKIIWGGGVFGPAKQFIERIYDEAYKWAQPISIAQVKFEASKLSSDAGLFGAAYLALSSSKIQ
ncbi:ROK family protein [Microbacter margulisiae]|uniref:Glucokinase n=1 Tax=Microbacter margulisiae TaxID=1350067 RepID=A0A7W5DT18_9PORP|nr:ROK family protein [Microbacter margulisiae]MBB3188534.1 glucokinase [Microbacter margulisiae]